MRYLQNWINQLRWQRLKPMEKLAGMLVKHLDGILNYCRTSGRGGGHQRQHQGPAPPRSCYRNLNYLLLKAQRIADTKTEFLVLRKAA